jgi:hypothetical protein
MIENENDPNARAVAEIIAILTAAAVKKVDAETEPAFAYELEETENRTSGDQR